MRDIIFLTHVGLSPDTRNLLSQPEATVDLLIEVKGEFVANTAKNRKLNVEELPPQQLDGMADEIARTAALDYLSSTTEFRHLKASNFIGFGATNLPDPIINHVPATKILPNGVRVWLLPKPTSQAPVGRS